MGESLQTRRSLLVRLRDVNDARAWEEFVDIYAPLIYRFCRKQGLQDADAADITQDILGGLSKHMPQFQYDSQRGSFRGWLFTAARNRLRDFLNQRNRRAQGSGESAVQWLLGQVPEREDGLEQEWLQEYRRQLYAKAAQAIRNDVQERTWQAFYFTAVEGKPATEVAKLLRISVAGVYLAKSRVMARLRAEIQCWDVELERESE